jgi:hypothetical protein
VLFAAGMSLLDTLDGSFMNFAYGWAFSEPARKVFYNLVITGLSVAVALVIGTVELAGLVAHEVQARGLFWSWLENINMSALGLEIGAMFVARTMHTTPSAPLRAHLRRRRDSQATSSRTRARWRRSYDLVFVSIATAIPVGEIATESMSPQPGHGSECRSRQPSGCSGAGARWTASSERAPTRLRRASDSQWRARRPSAAATMSRHTATRAALTLAAHRPRSAMPAAASPVSPARESRQYCWRRA